MVCFIKVTIIQWYIVFNSQKNMNKYLQNDTPTTKQNKTEEKKKPKQKEKKTQTTFFKTKNWWQKPRCTETTRLVFIFLHSCLKQKGTERFPLKNPQSPKQRFLFFFKKKFIHLFLCLFIEIKNIGRLLQTIFFKKNPLFLKKVVVVFSHCKLKIGLFTESEIGNNGGLFLRFPLQDQETLPQFRVLLPSPCLIWAAAARKGDPHPTCLWPYTAFLADGCNPAVYTELRLCNEALQKLGPIGL